MRLARESAGRQRVIVDSEPVLHRDEALGLLWGVADILDELRRIRRLLADGEKEEEEDLDEWRPSA